jgi:hypothetical protein
MLTLVVEGEICKTVANRGSGFRLGFLLGGAYSSKRELYSSERELVTAYLFSLCYLLFKNPFGLTFDSRQGNALQEIALCEEEYRDNGQGHEERAGHEHSDASAGARL